MQNFQFKTTMKGKRNILHKLTLLLILFATTAFSQEIEWQNTIGGSDNDWIRPISQTMDGGYIMGGSSQSSISGDKTENCVGGYDYWIIKLTDKFNLIRGQLCADLNTNGIPGLTELIAGAERAAP